MVSPTWGGSVESFGLIEFEEEAFKVYFVGLLGIIFASCDPELHYYG